MKITAGELVERLQVFDPDMELLFSGGLDFYRLKVRGPKLLQMEFGQHIYRGPDGEWEVEDPGDAEPV